MRYRQSGTQSSGFRLTENGDNEPVQEEVKHPSRRSASHVLGQAPGAVDSGKSDLLNGCQLRIVKKGRAGSLCTSLDIGREIRYFGVSSQLVVAC